MADNLDWRTRLAVTYTEEGGQPKDITPIDSFSPTFSLGVEAIHSIERTHVGAVFSPKSITFSLTVKAIGDVAARLTMLAMKGQRFDITLQERTGDDWAFNSVVLGNCIITSATPSSASPTGAPTATFSGFSMNASAEPKGTPAAVIP
jgi:hypothetical protein